MLFALWYQTRFAFGVQKFISKRIFNKYLNQGLLFHINNNPSKRPIVVHADHIEAKDVISVEIEMSEGMEIPLLFDNDHKIEERVYKEMFKSH